MTGKQTIAMSGALASPWALFVPVEPDLGPQVLLVLGRNLVIVCDVWWVQLPH